MTYLVVYQVSGTNFMPACGNCEHIFNGKPNLDDIRKLEDCILEEFIKPAYGKEFRKLSVIVTGLFPLGW